MFSIRTFAVLFLALLVSGSPLPAADPNPVESIRATTRLYLHAYGSGDVAAVKQLITQRSLPLLDRIDNPEIMKGAKVGGVVLSGKSATARLEMEAKEHSFALILFHEDGLWKVDLVATREKLRNNVAAAEADLLKVQTARVLADLELLRTQLVIYETLNGALPSTAQGLAALMQKPEGEPQPRRWRKQMTELPLDPWGQPYQYVQPAKKEAFELGAGEKYLLFSSGPDKKSGTSDDITDIGKW